MVSVESTKYPSKFCTGILLSEEKVVAQAGCINTLVYQNEIALQIRIKRDNRSAQLFNVSKFQIHPNYTSGYPGQNDLVLIWVNDKFNFNF